MGARLVTYGEANHTAAAGLTVGLGHTLNLILLLDGIAAKHTSISVSLTRHYSYTSSYNAGSCASINFNQLNRNTSEA